MFISVGLVAVLIGSLVNYNSCQQTKTNNFDFSKINRNCLLIESNKELFADDFKLLGKENGELVKILDTNADDIYCFSFDSSSEQEFLDIKSKIELLSYVKNVDFDYIGDNGEFNDTHKNLQWSIDNLKIEEIYNKFGIDTDISIGILDTGIDGDHEDLKNNIDYQLSKSFCDNSPLVDTDSHGTHITGIIGAIANNNKGVVGIASGIRLVSLKTNFYTSGIISALNYANTIGLKIINFSGYNFPYNLSFKNAIENYNGLFVTIAGNVNSDSNYIPLDIDNSPIYPASFKTANMIVVGNEDSNGNKSQSSNYGKETVDLFAPGENIYSTLPNNKYGYKNGTSMAAPLVAGTAALLLNQNQQLSYSELKSNIISSAQTNSNFLNYCINGKVLDSLSAIQMVHVHSYSHNYAWYDYTKHYSYCKCGVSSFDGHIVLQGSFGGVKKYATCLQCGGLATIGYVSIESCALINDEYYVLPNGVVVVNDEIAEEVKNNRMNYRDFVR